ncbi:hypothetical protein E2C01_022924 [Portunus trituberculatus]|uniref:Uncharacterized protein n=1 Tax=Portunus trituberculatus TaxID=210409 RepID=A0A5B7E8Y6_PORTR|nr:hypothetical protein [Portunus trituberculatus]
MASLQQRQPESFIKMVCFLSQKVHVDCSTGKVLAHLCPQIQVFYGQVELRGDTSRKLCLGNKEDEDEDEKEEEKEEEEEEEEEEERQVFLYDSDGGGIVYVCRVLNGRAGWREQVVRWWLGGGKPQTGLIISARNHATSDIKAVIGGEKSNGQLGGVGNVFFSRVSIVSVRFSPREAQWSTLPAGHRGASGEGRGPAGRGAHTPQRLSRRMLIITQVTGDTPFPPRPRTPKAAEPSRDKLLTTYRI